MNLTRNKTADVRKPRWQVLDATTLKLIAAALMVLDHVHEMFVAVGAPMWLTMAGRLVFPMFLFAAAESFHYTHSKRKYLQRLLFASWGMTIFTFLLQMLLPNPQVVLMNNAFSTFFVAGLYMLCWDWLMAGIRQRAPQQIGKAVLLCLVPILCALPAYAVAMLSFNKNVPGSVIRLLARIALLIPSILTVEGGAAFVALGLLLYIFRNHRAVQIAVLLALSLVVYLTGDTVQSFMALAAIPIALYNGERGRGMKNFFYIFYPAHIGLLYIIAALTA